MNVTITKLKRDEEGFWKCHISNGKKTFNAHCRYGSWMVDTKEGMKDVMPEVAAKIQERVRSIEKKDRISREKSEGKNART